MVVDHEMFMLLPIVADVDTTFATVVDLHGATDTCATFGETGSSMASLSSLERVVRSPLRARFCCGPAMHRWREPLASPLQMSLEHGHPWLPTAAALAPLLVLFLAPGSQPPVHPPP